jgi:hypothetical protein
MDYRLIEDHPLIGIKGRVFNREDYKSIHHFNRPLLEPLTDDYPMLYKFEIRLHNRTPMKYMFDSIFDIQPFLSQLTNIDDWVLLGIFNAAKEKRHYKHMGNSFTLTLIINE